MPSFDAISQNSISATTPIPQTLQWTTAALGLTTYAPSLKITIDLPNASLTLSSSAPSLKITLPMPDAALVLQSFAMTAQIDAAEDIILELPAASLTLESFAMVLEILGADFVFHIPQEPVFVVASESDLYITTDSLLFTPPNEPSLVVTQQNSYNPIS